jgi:hypothetical protein
LLNAFLTAASSMTYSGGARQYYDNNSHRRLRDSVRISVRLSFIMSERLIDATIILHYELEAPPVYRCVIGQLTVRE